MEPGGPLSDTELRKLTRLLARFVSHDLDPWENWRVDTSTAAAMESRGDKQTSHEKLWWARRIRANRYRYSYGRQANRTLREMALPPPPTFVGHSAVDYVVSELRRKSWASLQESWRTSGFLSSTGASIILRNGF